MRVLMGTFARLPCLEMLRQNKAEAWMFPTVGSHNRPLALDVFVVRVVSNELKAGLERQHWINGSSLREVVVQNQGGGRCVASVRGRKIILGPYSPKARLEAGDQHRNMLEANSFGRIQRSARLSLYSCFHC